MARNLQLVTANGTYKIADAYKRRDANNYECTLIAYANAQFTVTGSTASSTTLTVANVDGILPGMTITGTDIPASTTVSSVDTPTQITISQAATGTHASLTFTLAAGAWGGGTIAWKQSFDSGKTLVAVNDLMGTAITQTADGAIKSYPDTGSTLKSCTQIYAVLTGSTSAALTIGLSDNN